MTDCDDLDVLLSMLDELAPKHASDGAPVLPSPAYSTTANTSGAWHVAAVPCSSSRRSLDDTSTLKRKTSSNRLRVRELEKKIAEQEAAVERLQLNNAFLSSRVTMLELVIAVRDQQVQRVQSIKAGLNFNPFGPGFGHTIQEIKALGAPWVSKWYVMQMSELAQKLAVFQQQSAKYTFLIWGPEPNVRWPAFKVRIGRNGEVAPALPHFELQPPIYTGAWDESIKQELMPVVKVCHEVLQAYDAALLAYQFKLFMLPESSFTDGLNILTTAHLEPRAFDQMASCVFAIDQQNGVRPGKPVVAPESHWHQVLSKIHLTPAQRFQAAVLWDIFAQGLASIAQQRQMLGTSLDMMQGSATPSTSASSVTSENGSPDSYDRWGGGATRNVQRTPSRTDLAGAVAWKSAEVLQQEANLVKQLHWTVVKEGCLQSLIAETWRFHMLSPIQLSIMFVESYPYFPDMPALLRAATEQYKALRTSQNGLE